MPNQVSASLEVEQLSKVTEQLIGEFDQAGAALTVTLTPEL